MEIKYHFKWKGLRKVIRHPQLSRSAKLLIVDLLLYANQQGFAFPSETLLAKDLNFKSSRQIRSLIAELETHKLIKKKRGGFGSSNRYTFTEEIYCLNDTNQQTSSQTGSQVPQQSGTTFPTKVVSERSQLTSSQIELRSPSFSPCGQNGCDYGYIPGQSENSVQKCDCLLKFENQRKANL